jgi:hypothetical protein
LRRDLQILYEEFDAETARIAPLCRVSGRCCDFDAFGHTLFASAVEAEHLVEEGGPPSQNAQPGLCPWWHERRCTARGARPLGCRAFFCDASKEDAMAALHERFLTRLKRLHDDHGEPWNYAPLLRHLRCERP